MILRRRATQAMTTRHKRKWVSRDPLNQRYGETLEQFYDECGRRRVDFKETLGGLMRGWVERPPIDPAAGVVTPGE